jgi:RNA polymerase sigma factor (sigma-70 family)
MDETATLVPAVATTDEFEPFYERERRRLFGALCLITGDRFEAEEITQDAFIAVWERWDRVRAMESPAGYLYRTAMNGHRRRRRRAALAIRHAVRSATREDAFDTADSREVVRGALAALTRRQRTALVLTELLGFTSEEAGRSMAIRPATVRVLASQGRAALARAVGRIDE